MDLMNGDSSLPKIQEISIVELPSSSNVHLEDVI